jgi:hypothetical protein
VVDEANAPNPTATLDPPVVFINNAPFPRATLAPPVVLFLNAANPTATFLDPVVRFSKTLTPKPVFDDAVVTFTAESPIITSFNLGSIWAKGILFMVSVSMFPVFVIQFLDKVQLTQFPESTLLFLFLV